MSDLINDGLVAIEQVSQQLRALEDRLLAIVKSDPPQRQKILASVEKSKDTVLSKTPTEPAESRDNSSQSTGESSRAIDRDGGQELEEHSSRRSRRVSASHIGTFPCFCSTVK